MSLSANHSERVLKYDFYNSNGSTEFACTFGGFGRLREDALGLEFASVLLDEVYPKLKDAGVIQYGAGSRFDDRKYRLCSIGQYSRNGKLSAFFSLGVTTYPEVCADILRSPDVNLRMQAEGERRVGNRWAHFARSLGVAFVPVTLDGSVFLGKRESNLYPGFLNAAAGNVEFHGDEPRFSRWYDQAVTELREEYGRDIELVGTPRFAGIGSNQLAGDGDCVWVGRINVRDSYFESGAWLSHRVDMEHHAELVKVSSVLERNMLLETGSLRGVGFSGVMASTSLGLDYLTDADFKKL